jgi:hypothetical protein
MHIKHVFLTLLAWPDGIILGNLLASLIWGLPAILHLDRLARRHHKEHMDLLDKHHREVKEWATKSSKEATNS